MGTKRSVKNFCRQHRLIGRFIIDLYLLFPKISRDTRKEILDAIAEFKNSKPCIDRLKLGRLIRDMLSARILYGFDYDLYLLFEFYRKNDVGRKEYISETERILLQDRYNSKSGCEKLRDKEKCYKIFKDYYGRELLKLTDEKDLPVFTEFVNRHPRFIVKPFNSAFGKGVRVMEYTGGGYVTLLREILTLESGPAVIENVITQSEEMKKYHPNSVNTIRVLTFLDDKNEISVVFAFLRTGCGENIVDNAGAGGIAADVDIDSGTIISKGFKENGEIFLRHPDSNIIFPGTKIPKWKELLTTVEKLALMIPDVRMVGWDLALTDEGWILVEANGWPGFKSWQMFVETGAREKFESIMGKI